MQLSVQIITALQCIPLRSLVLRPGQPTEQCWFPEDELPTSLHLGIVSNERIISIGSFLKNSYSGFPSAGNPYQLRGMATDPEFRGHGAGAKLLKAAEMTLIERNCDLLWFNAREKAFQFYEKSGYVELDGVITVSHFGPHKVMYKKLENS